MAWSEVTELARCCCNVPWLFWTEQKVQDERIKTQQSNKLYYLFQRTLPMYLYPPYQCLAKAWHVANLPSH